MVMVVEKICYTERITNKEVMRRPAGERQLLNIISNSKTNFAGQILRRDEILKEVIEGRMDGKRGRGGPITGMLDEMIVASYGYTNRRTEDREGWRSKVLWHSMRQDTAEGYNRGSNTILNTLKNSSCQMGLSLDGLRVRLFNNNA